MADKTEHEGQRKALTSHLHGKVKLMCRGKSEPLLSASCDLCCFIIMNYRDGLWDVESIVLLWTLRILHRLRPHLGPGLSIYSGPRLKNFVPCPIKLQVRISGYPLSLESSQRTKQAIGRLDFADLESFATAI